MKKGIFKNKLFRTILIALCLAAIISMLMPTGFLNTWESKISDAFYHPSGVLSDIVIVEIDDESIYEIGQWPFSRDHYSTVINNLNDSKIIGIDILFDLPREGDARRRGGALGEPCHRHHAGNPDVGVGLVDARLRRDLRVVDEPQRVLHSHLVLPSGLKDMCPVYRASQSASQSGAANAVCAPPSSLYRSGLPSFARYSLGQRPSVVPASSRGAPNSAAVVGG